MKKIILLFRVISLCVLLTIILFNGCSSNETNSPVDNGNNKKDTVKTTAILKISIDTSCYSKCSDIDIYVDDLFWGRMQPGGVIKKDVLKGSHAIYCKGTEITGGIFEWKKTLIDVQNDYNYTPNCINASGMTLLTLTVDSGCNGYVSNISIYVNNELIGVTQPGYSVSKLIPIGNAQIYAKSENGWTWGPTGVVLWNTTFSWKLTCQ
jgi:hypothetical protein